MAKWGEGDPRWIVEERPDATNVNNWHWTEKNADSWSKAKLKVKLPKAVPDSFPAGAVREPRDRGARGRQRDNRGGGEVRGRGEGEQQEGQTDLLL